MSSIYDLAIKRLNEDAMVSVLDNTVKNSKGKEGILIFIADQDFNPISDAVILQKENAIEFADYIKELINDTTRETDDIPNG